MGSTHYSLRKFIFAITGPELVTVPTGFRTPSEPYNPLLVERIFSLGINLSTSFKNLLKWTSPFWLPFTIPNFLHQGYASFYFRIICTYYMAYFLLLFCRGIGRMMNPSYKRFVVAYINAEDNLDQNLIDVLTLYGFKYPWPSQFDVRNLEPSLRFERIKLLPRCKQNSSFLSPFLWLVANTIGVRMVYPGCLGVFNTLALQQRMQALDKLRSDFHARRVGLTTCEGLFVEAFYSDQRRNDSENGNTLVICCEGNAGFAEVGICGAPLNAGYSVLAWNHPGFGSSMGQPFPKEEKNAVEAVVLFAIHHLHFEPQDIRLFGWSIGGFSATWAAMHLPTVGGLILDATFDTLDELSRNALPIIGEAIPVNLVQRFFDLNNVEQITRYPGPIRIIRRSEDEIISTDSDNPQISNRGNFLAFGLLKYRFPFLFNEDTEVLFWKYIALNKADQEAYLTEHGIVDDLMAPILQREFRKEMLDFASSEADEDANESDSEGGLVMGLQRSLPFPSQLGKVGISEAMKRSILIYLTSKYFVETKGSHCTPLSPATFQEPWSESLLLSRTHNVSENLEPEHNESDESTALAEDEEEGNSWEKVA